MSLARPHPAEDHVRRSHPVSRRGLSILEVLISIVVATIGVFGVFVLIPFAVRQAKIGINEEMAITVARNGIADFETQRFHIPNRWATPDWNDTDPSYNFLQATFGAGQRVACIDPWGYTLKEPPLDEMTTVAQPPGLPAVENAFRAVPYFQPLAPTPLPYFPRITLLDTQNTVFSRGASLRMFACPDELVLTSPADDLLPPTPQYFLGGGGNGQRQSLGSCSWQVVVVLPNGPLEGDQTRFYTIISSERDPNRQDRVFRIEMPNNTNDPGLIQYGGGDLTLNEIPGAVPAAENLIRRGAWLMIVQTDENMATPTATDVRFLRVLESDFDPALPSRHILTLQGNDFFLLRDDPTTPTQSTMFAVLMPDVLAVYERTMRYETNSGWN